MGTAGQKHKLEMTSITFVSRVHTEDKCTYVQSNTVPLRKDTVSTSHLKLAKGGVDRDT